MSIITILHLSDFHFKEKYFLDYDNKMLFENLLKDIETWRNNHHNKNIDLIFITGDIAFSGQIAEYELAFEKINRILEISGCLVTNLYIVPGNHDIDLEKITSDERKLWTEIRSRKININYELIYNPINYKYILDKFTNYSSFINRFGNPNMNGGTLKDGVIKPWYSNSIVVDNVPIRIIGITTPLFTGKTHDDLSVNTYVGQLKESLNDYTEDEYVFCLSHNPLSDADDPGEKKEIQTILSTHYITNIYGHTHESQNIIVSITPDRMFLSLSAGCLFVHSNYVGRYNIAEIDFNLKKIKLWPRRWFNTSKSWRLDPEWEKLDADECLTRDYPNNKIDKQVYSEPPITAPELPSSAQPPFFIKITPEKDTILTGGQSNWIIAQIFLGEYRCKYPGIKIDFSSDNDNIAILPQLKSSVTDENGQAWILLTSQDAPGIINVSVNAKINEIQLKDKTSVRTVDWGTIFGTIYDQNGVGIPNANVSLWYWTRNETTGLMERSSLVDIPENPQLSNDGRTAHIGKYCYYRVPSGDYCITGEKSGNFYYTIVHLEKGTVTANVLITGYNFIPPQPIIQKKSFFKKLFGK